MPAAVMHIDGRRIGTARAGVRKALLAAFGPVSVSLALTGCASYTPKPLGEQPNLASQGLLRIAARTLPLPALRNHRFDPTDGLDMTEVAMLAVVNNPDLKAQRGKAGVARAQLFAARMLPEPTLSATLDRPTSNAPELRDGYNFGLDYDLTKLITRGTAVDAAQAAAAQVDLEAVWAEWQTVQKARQLYVQMLVQAGKLTLLREAQRLYAQRYSVSAAALRRGDVTLDIAGTDLTALADADTRVSDAEIALNQTRHDLNALLGLDPATDLRLTPLTSAAAGELPDYRQVLTGLPARRPDLLALQAGYRSQEAALRGAVLAQFPSLSVGLSRARDTGGVNTVGFGITLNLPIFNSSRGEIAVQRATREQLHREYQARLDETAGQIHQLLQQESLLRARLTRLADYLPELERMARLAQQAYAAGNLDATIYLTLQTTWVDKQTERWDLEQSLWEARIALDTLAAWPEAALP